MNTETDAAQRPGRRHALRKSAIAASCAATLVCGLLAGCSSSKGSSSGSAPGVTRNSITIGVIEDETGAQASTMTQYASAFNAVVKSINASGGVYGRQIKLIYEDDATTTTGNLSAAQSLVASKGVFMLVEMSSFETASAQYLRAHNIPVVASESSPVFSNPNFFTAGGGLNSSTTTTATTFGNVFKLLGVKKVGALGLAISPISQSSARAAVASAAMAGLQKGYLNTSVQSGTTDWTPYILGFKNSNTDGMYCIVAATDCLSFLNAARQQGLNITMLGTSLYSNALLSGPSGSSMQGAIVATQFVPSQYNTPATMAEAKLLSENGAATTSPDFFGMWGYVTGELLLTGLKDAGPNPTRSSFIDNLRKETHWTAAGLAPQGVDFQKEITDPPIIALGPNNCIYLLRVQGRQFVPVQPEQPVCGQAVPES